METPHFLIWTDPDALSADELTQVAELLEEAFDQSTTFLAIQYDAQVKGKIPVLFRSDAGVMGFTTPQMGIVFQDYRRFLRVAPGMIMVHEITHIVTGRHEDYLIRHLDAPFLEEKLTGTYAPPGCGFTLHQQAAALVEAKLMVPIDQIPADGLQWGFKAGDLSSVENPQRLHYFYAEAGSFGQYLIERYGVEAMNRLRSRPDRAWTYAYGKPLEVLEQEWLNLLEEVRKGSPLLIQRLAAAAQASEPCKTSRLIRFK